MLCLTRNSIVLKENIFHGCLGRKGLLPSGLSITSMLMMCTGTALVDPFVSKYARTWSYTFSSQVNIRSYLVLLSWKRSGFSFILIFLSRICNIPFSKKMIIEIDISSLSNLKHTFVKLFVLFHQVIEDLWKNIRVLVTVTDYLTPWPSYKNTFVGCSKWIAIRFPRCFTRNLDFFSSPTRYKSIFRNQYQSTNDLISLTRMMIS